MKRPWYADGLRFACKPDCGACCTSHGSYDYVYLDGDDDTNLAAHLGLTLAGFRRRYTVRDDGHLVLRMDGPDCPFLDGTRCTVYEARPTQCRTFPFWRENLGSRAKWEGLAAFCPGIGQGDRVPLLSIRDRLDEQARREDES